MSVPVIPAGTTQAVAPQTGTYNFVQPWYAFFQSLLAYVSTGPIGPVPLQGVSDGSNAAAGIVGEYLSSIKTVAAGVSIANNTNTQITSLLLTPGDWDLWGEVAFGQPTGGAATLAAVSVSLWTTTAAMPTPSQYPADGATAADFAQLDISDNDGPTLQLGSMAVNITSNTTFYLNALANFSATTLLVGGAIRARRRR